MDTKSGGVIPAVNAGWFSAYNWRVSTSADMAVITAKRWNNVAKLRKRHISLYAVAVQQPTMSVSCEILGKAFNNCIARKFSNTTA